MHKGLMNSIAVHESLQSRLKWPSSAAFFSRTTDSSSFNGYNMLTITQMVFHKNHVTGMHLIYSILIQVKQYICVKCIINRMLISTMWNTDLYGVISWLHDYTPFWGVWKLCKSYAKVLSSHLSDQLNN